MTVLGFIRAFLAMIAARLYLTVGHSFSIPLAVILMFLAAACSLFQRGNLFKKKLKLILKHRFHHCRSYISKEKRTPKLNILKSIFKYGMPYYFREWTNPVVYFCTENSGSESKDIGESESSSEEESSLDESEDNVENGTKMDEGIDDSVPCITSTKAVFEHLPLSEQTRKRKAECEIPGNSKRSKWMQDKHNNIQSDPRVKDRTTPKSRSCSGSSRRLEENQSSRMTQDNTPTWQEIASNSNTETDEAEKSSVDSSNNALHCPLIFPNINFSSVFLTDQLKRLESHSSGTGENVHEGISEVLRQFCKNFRFENKTETVQTLNENISLGCPTFSNDLEEKSESSDLKSTSVDCFESSSDIHPCSSTSESKDASKVKSYPGFSLQPLEVKKDAMYQKFFYAKGKEIILPKKLGEVIQWMAKKPREEFAIPTSGVLPSDENDLPIDKYHEKAQEVAQSIMAKFARAREQRAKNKFEKKCRKEQKEQMRRENTGGYLESSFKEESPSTESSSDSMPTSGDSPVKAPIPPGSHPKLSAEYDISMVEVSPLKPVAKVSPSVSSQPVNSCQAPPNTLNIRHLSDDENACEEPSSDSSISRDVTALSVLIKFIDTQEVVNPENVIFYRDMLRYPILDAPGERQRLKSFFRIESVALVSCSPVSVEEFLYELRSTEEIYYRAYYERSRVFKVYRNSMTICVIPLRLPQNPNRRPLSPNDYKLEEHTNYLVKREQEQNTDQFTADSDQIVDVDMPGRGITDTESLSCDEARRGQNRREQQTAKTGNIHLSPEILVRNVSPCTFRDADWTLCEIELGKIKPPRERSGELSCQNIPTPGADFRIQSEMEEWGSDAYQSNVSSAANSVKKKHSVQNATPDSSMDVLPVHFGYPSPEVLMEFENIPDSRWCTVSSLSRRKTKSESSIYDKSSLLAIERNNTPPETPTIRDASKLCRKKPAACVRDKASGKLSETEYSANRTETNFNESATVGKVSVSSESNPNTIAPEQQDVPSDGRVIIKKEESKHSGLPLKWNLNKRSHRRSL